MKIELLKGDCFEEIMKISDGSIDCLMTDPPYGISHNSQITRENSKFARFRGRDLEL